MITKEYKKVELEKCIPYGRNNKTHLKNVDNIVDSIKANTYLSPIIIDKETNTILVGHGRKLALEKLGVKEEYVLVVGGLSDKQKKDYRLRDNKLSELSERNIENIKFELDEIGDIELNNLFSDLDKTEDIDFDDIKSNEDREKKENSKEVVCPMCEHKFKI